MEWDATVVDTTATLRNLRHLRRLYHRQFLKPVTNIKAQFAVSVLPHAVILLESEAVLSTS